MSQFSTITFRPPSINSFSQRVGSDSTSKPLDSQTAVKRTENIQSLPKSSVKTENFSYQDTYQTLLDYKKPQNKINQVDLKQGNEKQGNKNLGSDKTGQKSQESFAEFTRMLSFEELPIVSRQAITTYMNASMTLSGADASSSELMGINTYA